MSRRLPKLCLHKSTGRAYVTDPYTGKAVYLGTWGTPEAQANYDAWIRQFLDRRKEVASGAPPGASVTVAGLILDYLEHARAYYRKGGKETTEIDALKGALAPVNELYGTISADGFGPSELKKVRDWMIAAGWARTNTNKQVQRIRRVFRWGVEHGIVRTETLAALESVPGLRRGRTAAAETAKVQPVALAVVEATLPRLRADVKAMVLIQLHADMRPGEICIMRPCDIDRTVTPWLYVPHTHKTEHHDRQRRIYLGPKARAVLAPFLLKCGQEDAWLFPSRARGKHAATRTHWTVSGYRQAIQDACLSDTDQSVPIWHPSQLRHTMATTIRQQFGAEAAQAVLGHAQLETTEIYAEKNEELMRTVMESLG